MSTKIEKPMAIGDARTMLQIIREQFFENKPAVLSLTVIIFFVVAAVFADPLCRSLAIDPFSQDILGMLGPWDSTHLLGTDEVGRDVLARLLFGTRISLTVALVSALSSAVIGITIGALAGYFGGFVDSLLMRVTDALLALPTLPILIILAAVDFGKLPFLGTLLGGEDSSIFKMILILVAFSWMIQARLVRGEILSIKESEFVLAAKTSGMNAFMIITSEILPNVLTPIIVSVTLNTGQAILYEAALSFLGLGIQPPAASWGNMLFNAREIVYNAPSLAVIPGLLILVIVMAFNFLGDGLQEAMDPKAIRR